MCVIEYIKMEFIDLFLSSILIVLLFIIASMMCKTSEEGLISKPSDRDINIYIVEVIKNKNLFGPHGTFYAARELMPWLDALTYEDMRKLLRENRFTADEIQHAFH
jgi:predicted type IV restriction endonuclease